MSTQDIVARILSDATAEADDIVKSAQAKAQKIAEEATVYAETARQEAETEARARVESILEKCSAKLIRAPPLPPRPLPHPSAG